MGAVLPFVAVANLFEIPERSGLRVQVEVEGRGIGIGLYRVDEVVYAMEDACPHAGFPLSRGELSGCVITCDAHGWPFDVRTGFDPRQSDGFPIPCFAVKIEGDRVLVDPTVRVNDPPRHSARRVPKPPTRRSG